jgi:hypothetical protein
VYCAAAAPLYRPVATWYAQVSSRSPIGEISLHAARCRLGRAPRAAAAAGAASRAWLADALLRSRQPWPCSGGKGGLAAHPLRDLRLGRLPLGCGGGDDTSRGGAHRAAEAALPTRDREVADVADLPAGGDGFRRGGETGDRVLAQRSATGGSGAVRIRCGSEQPSPTTHATVGRAKLEEMPLHRGMQSAATGRRRWCKPLSPRLRARGWSAYSCSTRSCRCCKPYASAGSSLVHTAALPCPGRLVPRACMHACQLWWRAVLAMQLHRSGACG